MKTLKASLLASVIGTAAWMLGLTRRIWPAHPQWALFFLTLVVTIVLRYVWPERWRRIGLMVRGRVDRLRHLST